MSETNFELRIVDLFSGTGAFTYAFHKNQNVKTVFANDILDSSEKIFNANNFGVKLTKQNINEIKNEDIPTHDLLTAGFPCQPFSIAGMQKGFNDERSNVFWKILSILKYHKTKIVILENVKNLQSHDNGNTFKIIIDNLEKIGYHIKHKILNTCDITNVPQNRERIYIIGFLDTNLCNHFDFNFENITNKPIINFLENNVQEKYYYNSKLKVYEEIKQNINKHILTNTVYQYRRYYVRENKNNVCPTLTANMGSGGHNVPIILDDYGIRKLTPRECFNLQGFPNDYIIPNLSDSKLYSLAGNAVSIPIIQLIATKIIDLYTSTY
jgi:DNA (cytosine-5)-methyltransferase 1